MAKVQGVKEKLHFPLYDAFFVPETKNFQEVMTDPRVIRFFVDIQNKTKLETNLQAAGVLPSLNTYEARALRVVVSNLRLAEKKKVTLPEKPEKGVVIETEAQISESEILADLIFTSVTSLLVGEKVMVEAPTFWFPSGAGVFPGFPNVSSHGEPDPMATFRFAEPVFIEPQQNFRVEILFPRGVPGQGTPNPDATKLAGMKGPLHIWVALDGYLTRDVQ